jgi:hypothetical protein
VLVHGILTVEHLKLNHPGFSLQLHRTTAPMHQRASAQGGNAAPPVGFFLQSLLKSLARPLAAFRHHFHLDLPHRARPLRLCVHPFPLVEFFRPTG